MPHGRGALGAAHRANAVTQGMFPQGPTSAAAGGPGAGGKTTTRDDTSHPAPLARRGTQRGDPLSVLPCFPPVSPSRCPAGRTDNRGRGAPPDPRPRTHHRRRRGRAACRGAPGGRRGARGPRRPGTPPLSASSPGRSGAWRGRAALDTSGTGTTTGPGPRTGPGPPRPSPGALPRRCARRGAGRRVRGAGRRQGGEEEEEEEEEKEEEATPVWARHPGTHQDPPQLCLQLGSLQVKTKKSWNLLSWKGSSKSSFGPGSGQLPPIPSCA